MPSEVFRAYDLVVATAVVSIAVALHALDVSGARGSTGLERSRLDNGPTLLLGPSPARPAAVHPRGGGPRAASGAAGAPSRRAPALVRETLPSGMHLVVKRDASAPVVAMRALWTGGLDLETPATSGIGSLLAGAMTRGCEQRDAAALARRVSELDGVLAGVVGRSTFGLRAEWPARAWREGLALVADCALAPRLEAEAVAREKRLLLDAAGTRARSPRFLAFRTFAEALYPGHPYGMDPAGTAASVAALDRRQVASFYRRNFPASELTLVIVGDIDPAQVVARARRVFGDRGSPGDRERRPAAAGSSPARDTDRAAGVRERYRYLHGDEAYLVLGFPGTTIADPDRFALQVLAALLGGPGGRLQVELRARRGLAYRVGAVSVEGGGSGEGGESGPPPGYLAVHLACRPERLPAAVRSVRAELARAATAPVQADELARAKQYLIDLHEAASRRQSAQAAALAFHAAHDLDPGAYLGYAERIRAVDAADVARVAAAYIDWDVAITATVEPPVASPEARRRAKGVKRRVKKRRGRTARARGQ